ncbi:MAG TPA: hypothetical protein VFE05_22845 [Longimicrobiaceae bacterium]|jgi:hypothetical protein|nr:hypothetical protein [Longimicrobiaceae bacterium]
MSNPDDPTLPNDSGVPNDPPRPADPLPPPPHARAATPGAVFPPPPPSTKKSSGCLKGCLIAAAGVVLLVILVGVAGSYWWKKNGKQIMAAGDAAKVEGAAAAKGTDEQGCVTQALARAGKHTDLSSAMASGGFVDGCLKGESRPSAELCAGVPAPTEIMATARWPQDKCRAMQPTEPACVPVMQEVARFCAAGKPKTGATVTGDTTGAPGGAASTSAPAGGDSAGGRTY